jgi:2-methylcitrate dehydratase PrpD
VTAPRHAATAGLADFVADLRPSDIPDDVSVKVRDLFLDFVGAVVGGSVLPEVEALARPVRERGAHPVASVLGGSVLTSVPDAAFCNGVAGDVLEHQDGYRFGGFHPSHLLPALLAVAEYADASLRDLLTAATASYEVSNRIGRAVHPAATARGWFPPAAGYGAAAGSARLLGLDAAGTAAAMGAASYFVPAVLIDSIFGGWTAKPAFAGQLARAGAEGALAAAEGLTGWPEVLEAPRGVVDLLGGDRTDGGILDRLGENWTVLDVHQKRFAGCRHTHAAAQAATQLVAEHGLVAAEVEAVEVEAYAVAEALVDRHVSSGASAIACTLSLPYVTAAAMIHGEVTGRQYAREAIDDPQVQALARLVTLRTAPDLEARYPDFTASRVTIRVRGGGAWTTTVDLPAGDARAPLARAELLSKYHGYTDPVLGREASQAAAQLILGPAATSSVRDLTALLRSDTKRTSR